MNNNITKIMAGLALVGASVFAISTTATAATSTASTTGKSLHTVATSSTAPLTFAQIVAQIKANFALMEAGKAPAKPKFVYNPTPTAPTAPAVTAPAPVITTPAPVVSTPAPVVVKPTPTPTPVASVTPAPVVTTPPTTSTPTELSLELATTAGSLVYSTGHQCYVANYGSVSYGSTFSYNRNADNGVVGLVHRVAVTLDSATNLYNVQWYKCGS
jgi:hypothetical protein